MSSYRGSKWTLAGREPTGLSAEMLKSLQVSVNLEIKAFEKQLITYLRIPNCPAELFAMMPQ